MACVAAAPPSGADDAVRRAEQRITSLFPRGTTFFSVESALAVGYEDGQQLPSLAVGGDYFFVDNISVGLEASGYGYLADGQDTAALGLLARYRHHIFTGDDASVFLNLGFGPVLGLDEVPVGGTRFNFTSRVGVGATLRLRGDCFLLGGVDWFHVSNGKGSEEDNPAINSVQAFVGIGLTL